MKSKLLNELCNMPRKDYPRPQWMREDWICLNGEWQFAFDFGKSGKEREMVNGGDYPLKIIVPFCPESRLSGIGYTDFIPAVWYKRAFELQDIKDKTVLLNFGAVDYQCEVYINGVLCGTHKGGYSPFTIDITSAATEGQNIITVYAEDDTRSGLQPVGKQCKKYNSAECSYTRTTGIWQTVWVEVVSKCYLSHSKIIPDASNGKVDITLFAKGDTSNCAADIVAYYNGCEVGSKKVLFSGASVRTELLLEEKHLWEPGKPELYDLAIKLYDVNTLQVKDNIQSYFALRDVSLGENGLLINGKPVFMRLVLDQGFNSEGIYTAPDDDFLKKDIELSMKLGFNGARLHMRTFEDRTLYWADKLGYIVWDEFAMGWESEKTEMAVPAVREWLEIIEHGFNHPSIIGWCPLNETYGTPTHNVDVIKMFYDVTKSVDSSRPVIGCSGGMHYSTDMYDVHDYEQNSEVFASSYAAMENDDKAYYDPIPKYQFNKRNCEYKGEPYWVSEYGGTFWKPMTDNSEGWGYGDAPRSEEEFAERYVGLTKALLSNSKICGFCYTQLTDVEQEQNGLYCYDRSEKFSAETYRRIKEINTAISAFEEKNKY